MKPLHWQKLERSHWALYDCEGRPWASVARWADTNSRRCYRVVLSPPDHKPTWALAYGLQAGKIKAEGWLARNSVTFSQGCQILDRQVRGPSWAEGQPASSTNPGVGAPPRFKVRSQKERTT